MRREICDVVAVNNAEDLAKALRLMPGEATLEDEHGYYLEKIYLVEERLSDGSKVPVVVFKFGGGI